MNDPGRGGKGSGPFITPCPQTLTLIQRHSIKASECNLIFRARPVQTLTSTCCIMTRQDCPFCKLYYLLNNWLFDPAMGLPLGYTSNQDFERARTAWKSTHL